MAPPPVSDKELKRTAQVYIKSGYNYRQAALASGVSERQIATRVAHYERKFGKIKRPPPFKRVDSSAVQTTGDRLAAQLHTTRRDLRNALRGLRDLEDIRRGVFDLKKVAPAVWNVAGKASTDGPGVPMLFSSDKQWGEVVRKRDMGGINEYNVDIATARFRKMVERAVDLSKRHMVNPEYPGFVYLRGGDEISGEIHADLAETNELSAIPAVKHLAGEEIRAIEIMAEEFGQVVVVSVPGNHGRTTFKPRSKHYADLNYESLLAWQIEGYFTAKGDKRVRFYTPASGDAVFKIYGVRFCLTHGDRIGSRGGQGFIGPSATIARGAKRVRDMYAKLARPIHYVMVGHFHTQLELEGCFANGSPVGYSEYARDARLDIQQPMQWLLFVHPRRGVTVRWPIVLEDPPRPPKGVPWFEYEGDFAA